MQEYDQTNFRVFPPCIIVMITDTIVMITIDGAHTVEAFYTYQAINKTHGWKFVVLLGALSLPDPIPVVKFFYMNGEYTTAAL